MSFSYYEKIAEELPKGWAICTVGDIAFYERGVTFPASAKELIPTENNIACIRTANVQDKIEIDNLLYISKSYLKNNENKLLHIGDIIMSTANSRELVGKSAIVETLQKPMTFGGFVTVIRCIKVKPRFLLMCLRNVFLQGAFAYKSTQTTNIANISISDIVSIPIFLPPVAEQERIISKYQNILKVVHNIEESLN